jgi:hypothetical protein
MDGGIKVTDLTWDTGSGLTVNNSDTSYFRQVSFDVTDFLQPNGDLLVNAHWTMSCGNDAINGSFDANAPTPNPEPGTIALLGIGLAGLAGVGARRKWKKKAVDKSLKSS